MLKNSFFVSLIYAFCGYVSRLYRGGFLCVIVDKIYGFFSRKWKGSAIVDFFFSKKSHGSGVCEGLFMKVKGVYAAVGGFLRRICDGSSVFRGLSGFMYALIALNTRAVGVLLCGISLGYSAALIIFGGNVEVYAVAVLAFGVILGCFNVNVAAHAEKSVLLSAADSLFGFGFSYKLRVTDFCGGAYVTAFVLGGLSGILLYKSAIAAVLLILAVFGACLAVKYPVLCVFAVTFVAPFVPTMLLAALVIFGFLCFAANSLYYGKFPERLSSLSVIICLFAAVGAVSAVTSFKQVSSIQVFAVTAALMLIYFVTVGTVKDKKTLFALLKVFMISGAAVAAYGLMQYLFGWGLDVKNAWIDEEMFENATVRVYSTLENPNVLGEYLLLTLFPCMIFMFRSEKWYSKILYGMFFAVMLLCLILTQSRGCWIGFMIGAAIYVTFMHGRLWGFLPLLVAAAPMLLPDSIIARFGSIGNLNDTSSSYRMFIWLGTVKMLKSFWLSGVGQGQQAFNAVYAYYSYSAINAPHAHNLYLQIFAESGIAAIGAFAAVCVSWFRRVAKVFRKTKASKAVVCSMSIAIGAGMAAYLVEGLFDYVFYNYRVLCLFWFVLGAGASLYNISEVADD